MKKIIEIILCIIIWQGTIAQVIDESLPVNGGFGTIGNDGGGFDYLAQSFYADVGIITKFGVYLREDFPEGEVVIAIITEDAFGSPDLSNILYESNLIDPALFGQWFYESGLNINVTPGKKYFVLIDGFNNNASGRATVGKSNSFTDTGEKVRWKDAWMTNWPICDWCGVLSIYVEGICNVTSSFSVSDTVFCQGEAVTFMNNSLPSLTYDWLLNGVSFSNDTNAVLTFDNTDVGVNTISLVAYSGVCKDTSSINIYIDISEYQQGVYLLRLIGDSGTLTRQFVVKQ